jgi:sugar phosphate isomerase/epimerase
MKYSIFTVMSPAETTEGIARKLKRFGYDGVEWRVKDKVVAPPDPLPQRDQWYWQYNCATLALDDIENEAARAAAICEENGLEKLSLASYVMPREIESVERLLSAARANGFRMIRLFPDRYDGTRAYPVLFSEVRSAMKEVERLARAYCVQVNLEIHMDTIIPSASAAWRLIEGLDEELIGVVYDAGNMVYEGYEQYQFGLELLGAHVHHVHIKDARQEALPEGGFQAKFCPIGEGQVRFDKLFAALKKQGYDGYFSFEDFSAKYPDDEKLTRNLAYIRSLWGD